jgi:hypothetical protein
VRWPFPGPVFPDIPTGDDNRLTTRLWKTPRQEGSEPSSFEGDFEELAWKV